MAQTPLMISLVKGRTCGLVFHVSDNTHVGLLCISKKSLVRAGHFRSSEVTFEMRPSHHRNDLRDKGDDHIGSQMDVDSDEGQRDGEVYEPSDEYELSDESSDEYESSDGYESSASSSLIRKPPGEVGRPGRGGYNLQAVLRNYGWSTKSFEKKREYIFKLIDKHLDTGLSFIYQDDEAVQTVVDAATKHFPQFKDFKNAWPILDFCKMRLKYTASRSRRKAERLAADMFDAQQSIRRRSCRCVRSCRA